MDFSLEKALDIVDELTKSKKIAAQALEVIFKDKSIPINERWTLFEKAVGGGIYDEVQTYVMDFDFQKQYNWDSWYDDFYLERYQEQNLVDLVESIIDRWWDEKAVAYENMKVTYLLTNQEFNEMIELDLEKIKEEILQSGYSSFIMDW